MARPRGDRAQIRGDRGDEMVLLSYQKDRLDVHGDHHGGHGDGEVHHDRVQDVQRCHRLAALRHLLERSPA